MSRTAAAVTVAIFASACVGPPPRPAGDLPGHEETTSRPMTLSAGGVVDGRRMPDEHACTDHEHLGYPPELLWAGEPADTAAFAITMIDLSAGAFVHWAVLNLPRTTHDLPPGALGPDLPRGAIELSNDFGKVGYGGPCPPKGDSPHTYVLSVYALRETIPGYAAADRPARGLDEQLRNRLSSASASLTITFDR